MLGAPQVALGVTEFGESGDIESLCRAMRIHAEDIADGVGFLILQREKTRRGGNGTPAGPVG